MRNFATFGPRALRYCVQDSTRQLYTAMLHHSERPAPQLLLEDSKVLCVCGCVCVCVCVCVCCVLSVAVSVCVCALGSRFNRRYMLQTAVGSSPSPRCSIDSTHRLHQATRTSSTSSSPRSIPLMYVRGVFVMCVCVRVPPIWSSFVCVCVWSVCVSLFLSLQLYAFCSSMMLHSLSVLGDQVGPILGTTRLCVVYVCVWCTLRVCLRGVCMCCMLSCCDCVLCVVRFMCVCVVCVVRACVCVFVCVCTW